MIVTCNNYTKMTKKNTLTQVKHMSEQIHWKTENFILQIYYQQKRRETYPYFFFVTIYLLQKKFSAFDASILLLLWFESSPSTYVSQVNLARHDCDMRWNSYLIQCLRARQELHFHMEYSHMSPSFKIKTPYKQHIKCDARSILHWPQR